MKPAAVAAMGFLHQVWVRCILWVGIRAEVDTRDVLGFGSRGNKFNMPVAKGDVASVLAVIVDWVGNIVAGSLKTVIAIQEKPGSGRPGHCPNVSLQIAVRRLVMIGPALHVIARLGFVRVAAAGVTPPCKTFVARTRILFASRKVRQIVQNHVSGQIVSHDIGRADEILRIRASKNIHVFYIRWVQPTLVIVAITPRGREIAFFIVVGVHDAAQLHLFEIVGAGNAVSFLF